MTMCFRTGIDLMCPAMQSTVYSRTSVIGWFEKFHLSAGDVGTAEAEFAFDCVCVWRDFEKVVHTNKVGARSAWSTHTVFAIPSLSIVTVCDWTIMQRKSSIVQSNNLLPVLAAKDYVSLSFVTVSWDLATNSTFWALNSGVSRTRRLLLALFHSCKFLERAFTFERSVQMQASILVHNSHGDVFP